MIELALLIFANPRLQVTHVQINGLRTLATRQVFDEARVPGRMNIFWMAIHEPFGRRLERDPVIDHISRTIILPRTLVLNVTERRPYAALQVADASGATRYWLLDAGAVPFRVADHVPGNVPVVEWQGAVPPIVPGQRLADPRLGSAYVLLALVSKDPDLRARKITVDQNANLCLNSVKNVQIKLGQVDALPEKIRMARAALSADNGDLAQRMASLDLSSPQQPVYTSRVASDATLSDAGSGSADRQERYGQ